MMGWGWRWASPFLMGGGAIGTGFFIVGGDPPHNFQNQYQAYPTSQSRKNQLQPLSLHNYDNYASLIMQSMSIVNTIVEL